MCGESVLSGFSVGVTEGLNDIVGYLSSGDVFDPPVFLVRDGWECHEMLLISLPGCEERSECGGVGFCEFQAVGEVFTAVFGYRSRAEYNRELSLGLVFFEVDGHDLLGFVWGCVEEDGDSLRFGVGFVLEEGRGIDKLCAEFLS